MSKIYEYTVKLTDMFSNVMDKMSSKSAKLATGVQEVDKSVQKVDKSVKQLKDQLKRLKENRDNSFRTDHIDKYNKMIDATKQKLQNLQKSGAITSGAITSGAITSGAITSGSGGGGMFGNMRGLLALGSVGAIISSVTSLASKVISTRAEFQKYEVVLANTLGSKSAAQRDMNMLQNFAEKTNFSLQEVTGSYVKMVNRGMKPTRQELMYLADLANSTGKDYDQLTEAILDAQTGEFERLKEFGILAEKHGDKVKFTFKGVSQEVKYTAENINAYIMGLGKLEGVSGSTEAISKTLGGQISNLGDSFDKLFNAMGTRLDTFPGKIIGFFTDMTNGIADQLLTQDEFILKSLGDTISSYANDAEKKFDKIKTIAKASGKDIKAELDKTFATSLQTMNLELFKQTEALAEFDKKNKGGLFGTGFASGVYKMSDEKQKERESLNVNRVLLDEKIKAITDAYNKASKTTTSNTGTTTNINSVVAKPTKLQDDTIKGGVKATTVNITIGKFMDKMADKIQFANVEEGATDLENAVLDTLNRIINGAVYTARQ